jgi:hypothetical protein
MLGFRLAAEKPPEARRVTDVVVERFEHVYEVDPALMTRVPQQNLANWDVHRIVESRWEHLRWMHDHWADSLVHPSELIRELEEEEGQSERAG